MSELRHRNVGALSLGQRQRVSLASAWLGSPAVVIVDEPTNGLDEENRALVIAALARQTAVVATHDRELAGMAATRIMRLNGGAIA